MIHNKILTSTKGAKNYAEAIFVGIAFISLFASNAFAEETHTLQNSAIAAIQSADKAGADTRQLVNRLNVALKAADSPGANSCSSTEECRINPMESFQSIEHDANSLRDEVTRNSYIQLALSQAIAMFAAFVVAIGALFMYHLRNSIQLNRHRALSLTRKR